MPPRELRSALKDVVSKRGTAFGATIPGYSAGAKPAPPHRKPGGAGYYDNRYVTSFVGFFPADDPQVVCLVMAYDPKAAENLTYGGLVAGPHFRRSANRPPVTSTFHPMCNRLLKGSPTSPIRVR